MSKVFGKQLQIAVEKKEVSNVKLVKDFIAKHGVAVKNATMKTISDDVKAFAVAALKKGIKMSDSFRTKMEEYAGVEKVAPKTVTKKEVSTSKPRGTGEF